MRRRLFIIVPVVASMVAAGMTAIVLTAGSASAGNGPAWPIETWGTPAAPTASS